MRATGVLDETALGDPCLRSPARRRYARPAGTVAAGRQPRASAAGTVAEFLSLVRNVLAERLCPRQHAAEGNHRSEGRTCSVVRDELDERFRLPYAALARQRR